RSPRLTTRRWMVIVVVTGVGLAGGTAGIRLWRRSVFYQKQVALAAFWEAEAAQNLKETEASLKVEIECLREESNHRGLDWDDLRELRRRNIVIDRERISELTGIVNSCRESQAAYRRVANHPWETLRFRGRGS